MGAIHLPEQIDRLIEEKVAEGRSSSPAAFVEEAVLRLLENDAELEYGATDELREIIARGEADYAAGRYIEINTPEQHHRFWASMMERVKARLASEGR